LDAGILLARAREQYVASLAALANASAPRGKRVRLEVEDLPADLARLVQDYLQTRPRQRLVLLSHQQFVDGQLQAVTGDRTVVPDGAEFASLSRSLTLVAADGTHAVVDLFVGRFEPAPPFVRPGKRPLKAAVKRMRGRRKATSRARRHA
jgi:hypothetical protein